MFNWPEMSILSKSKATTIFLNKLFSSSERHIFVWYPLTDVGKASI